MSKLFVRQSSGSNRRDKDQRSLHECFRETTMLRILGCDLAVREAYLKKVSLQNPTYMDHLHTWQSSIRLGLQEYSGFNGDGFFLLNRLGWIMGFVLIVSRILAASTHSAGAWLVLMNHILLNGVQIQILGSLNKVYFEEGKDFHVKSRRNLDDSDNWFAMFDHLLRSREGDDQTFELAEDSQVGKAVSKSNRTHSDPISVLATILMCVCSVQGLVMTLVSRVFDILQGYKSGVSVGLSVWAEPLCLFLFIVQNLQFAMIGAAVVWNLANTTSKVEKAFDLLFNAVSNCAFDKVNDAETLAATYPPLLKLVRDTCSLITSKLLVPCLISSLLYLVAFISFTAQAYAYPAVHCVPGWQLAGLCTYILFTMGCEFLARERVGKGRMDFRSMVW